MSEPKQNNDTILWRDAEDYYSTEIILTEDHSIGISVSGETIVAPAHHWFQAGKKLFGRTDLATWKKKLALWLLK